MAEKTRNLCAEISEELHGKVRQRQNESGKTLSQYGAVDKVPIGPAFIMVE